MKPPARIMPEKTAYEKRRGNFAQYAAADMIANSKNRARLPRRRVLGLILSAAGHCPRYVFRTPREMRIAQEEPGASTREDARGVYMRRCTIHDGKPDPCEQVAARARLRMLQRCKSAEGNEHLRKHSSSKNTKKYGTR